MTIISRLLAPVDDNNTTSGGLSFLFVSIHPRDNETDFRSSVPVLGLSNFYLLSYLLEVVKHRIQDTQPSELVLSLRH